MISVTNLDKVKETAKILLHYPAIPIENTDFVQHPFLKFNYIKEMEPIKENIVDQETDFEPIGYVKKLYIRNANNLKKCMINTLVISIM